MSDDILFELRGHAGIITLNRPRALNAHTHDMAVAMHRQLEQWALDDEVALVIIRGAGERAFCAGGDIRALHEVCTTDPATCRRFYWDEYRLIALIHDYPKPYVALMHGHVMGGGAGLSVHASHRVTAEDLSFAMPECSIGLFPDVGASWFLPRLPGRLGMYLGLTGMRIGADDAVHAGLADVIVPRAAFEDIVEELSETDEIEAVLGHYARKAGRGSLQMLGPLIDTAFGRDGVEEIVRELSGNEGEWARRALAAMKRNAPTSLKVTFEQLRRGAELDFGDCMRMEYRLACHMATAHDFAEGIRARIIDKDDAPRWKPARLEDVDEARVAAMFAPLEEELVLDEDM